MTKKKFFAITLFSFPVLFFIISYFLNTVSAEDIYQGANTFTGAFESAINVLFNHGRLADAYGFFVIKFFNYQFEFGVDFFFRLIDVFMGCATIYLLVAFALGRRLQLTIKDALLFNIAAILLFLAPIGRTLYSGFSIIHNYLLIGLLPLLFFIPFIRELNGAKLPQSLFFNILMFMLGVIFGLSSNLVPLAFIIALLIIGCYKLCRHQTFQTWLLPWKVSSLLGVVTGILLSFFVFSGINGYMNESYMSVNDYLPFTDLLISPVSSLPKLFTHEFHNFRRLLLPLGAVAIALFAFYFVIFKRHHATKLHFSKTQKILTFFVLIFMFTNMLTLSQIIAPHRLIYPAYLCGIIFVLILVSLVFDSFITRIPKTLLVIATSIISLILVVTHAYLLLSYRAQTAQILYNIKTSPKSVLCINRSDTTLHHTIAGSPLLAQDEMLIDWTMPAQIYNKTVTFCPDDQT